MRNRIRAAYACLRGRPVVVNCHLRAPLVVGLDPGLLVAGNIVDIPADDDDAHAVRRRLSP